MRPNKNAPVSMVTAHEKITPQKNTAGMWETTLDLQVTVLPGIPVSIFIFSEENMLWLAQKQQPGLA